MTNPAPRPALRKAPDADVHPASQQTPQEIDLRNRQISVTEPAPSPNPQAPLVKHEQVVTLPDTSPEADADGEFVGSRKKSNTKKSAKQKKNDKKQSKKQEREKGKQSKKSKPSKGKSKKSNKIKSNKIKGKAKEEGKKSIATPNRIDLRAKVPASVRRTLRSSTKARGTSVEDNVDSVLTGWRPNDSN